MEEGLNIKEPHRLIMDLKDLLVEAGEDILIKCACQWRTEHHAEGAG